MTLPAIQQKDNYLSGSFGIHGISPSSHYKPSKSCNYRNFTFYRNVRFIMGRRRESGEKGAGKSFWGGRRIREWGRE
jgi:hypothetical protein